VTFRFCGSRLRVFASIPKGHRPGPVVNEFGLSSGAGKAGAVACIFLTGSFRVDAPHGLEEARGQGGHDPSYQGGPNPDDEA